MGFDRPGADLQKTPLYLKNFEKCADKCKTTTDCVGMQLLKDAHISYTYP